MSFSGPFKFSLQAKLLLLSMVILSIPWIGFEYLRELERYMRDALETSLVDAAKATAAPLYERDSLFKTHNDNPGETLFVHEMNHPVQIDGYTEDWDTYIAWSDSYRLPAKSAAPGSLSYKLIVGHYQQMLYALIQVKDHKLVYRQAGQPGSIDNDHVELVLSSQSAQPVSYYFSPLAPGEIRPFSWRSARDEFGEEHRILEYATNIRGSWQVSAAGYNLEIAIPVSMAGDRMGFVVGDSDGRKMTYLGTAGRNTASRPGRLLKSSAMIRQIISDLGQPAGRRVWVLDNQGQVLASSGTLDKVISNTNRNIFYSLILPSVSTRFKDDLAGKSRLRGEEIKQALAGKTETRWRSSPDGRAVIVSAATPIWVQHEVRGVVVVEASTSGIQMLQRNAIASLFNKTLFIFVVVTGLLLWFATRLSRRIKRLSQQAHAAIDEHGRVAGDFQVDKIQDEIGELSRNYAAMLVRLRQYNHYLENMAGRLAHELRTPIAVVQSSLEQLQSGGQVEDEPQYLLRAKQGTARLNLILTRLGEATRLEQAMQSADKEAIDIIELLRNCIEGYRLAYPKMKFNLSITGEKLTSVIAPDLFVQMLDKLIANAVDFSANSDTVQLKLEAKQDSWQLAVINYGSTLPENMEEQLFNSMVSVREHKSGNVPHLGLGLYIVRLIAEYSGGRVTAENLPGSAGVSFIVEMPVYGS